MISPLILLEVSPMMLRSRQGMAGVKQSEFDVDTIGTGVFPQKYQIETIEIVGSNRLQ